jgi:hypothetical protein
MNFRQKLLTKIVPKNWAEEMEEHSESWKLRCEECGLERSVWEVGDVRWRGVGSPSRYRKCPVCHEATWHKYYRRVEKDKEK